MTGQLVTTNPQDPTNLTANDEFALHPSPFEYQQISLRLGPNILPLSDFDARPGPEKVRKIRKFNFTFNGELKVP